MSDVLVGVFDLYGYGQIFFRYKFTGVKLCLFALKENFTYDVLYTHCTGRLTFFENLTLLLPVVHSTAGLHFKQNQDTHRRKHQEQLGVHFRCRQQTLADVVVYFQVVYFTKYHIKPSRRKSLSLCNCPRACKVQ